MEISSRKDEGELKIKIMLRSTVQGQYPTICARATARQIYGSIHPQS
jgi:hypothetical protein